MVWDEDKFSSLTGSLRSAKQRLTGDATTKNPENLLIAEKTEALMVLLTAGSAGAVPLALGGIDVLAGALGTLAEPAIKAFGAATGAGVGSVRKAATSTAINKTRVNNGITFKQLYERPDDAEVKSRQEAFGNVGGTLDNRQLILGGAAEDQELIQNLNVVFGTSKQRFKNIFTLTYNEFLGNQKDTRNSVLNDILTACRKGNIDPVGKGVQHGFMRVVKMFLLNDWCFSCITVARRTALQGLYIRDAVWRLGENNTMEVRTEWTKKCKIEYDHGLEQMIEFLPNFLHSNPGNPGSDDYTNARELSKQFDEEFGTGETSYFEGCKVFFENQSDSLLVDTLSDHFAVMGAEGVIKYIASKPGPEQRELSYDDQSFRSLAIDAVLIISFLRLLVPEEGIGESLQMQDIGVDESIEAAGVSGIVEEDIPSSDHVKQIVEYISHSIKIEGPFSGKWQPDGTASILQGAGLEPALGGA
jgi:hypothetical protein